jgi:hypothetical protein
MLRAALWGVLYLGALAMMTRGGAFEYPTPVPVQLIALVAAAIVYGVVAESWWTLLAPLIVALLLLVLGNEQMENSQLTFGQVLAPIVFFWSEVGVVVGVLLRRAWLPAKPDVHRRE